jgi:ribonuclease I
VASTSAFRILAKFIHKHAPGLVLVSICEPKLADCLFFNVILSVVYIYIRKHEWEKHGTCALGLPQVTSESDYFNLSLALRAEFDFGPILRKSNIQPDDTLLYDLNKIKFAIQSQLNVEPMLVCYVLRDSDVQYLSQMQICLSKQLELVDCAFEAIEIVQIFKDNTPQEIQCQSGLPIHYPTIKYVQSLAFLRGGNKH